MSKIEEDEILKLAVPNGKLDSTNGSSQAIVSGQSVRQSFNLSFDSNMAKTCHQVNSTTADIFTDDLISEFLVRLPVKSLLRFKSASKTWSSLISSSSFVKSHLCRAAEANETLIAREDLASVSVVRLDSFQLVTSFLLPCETWNEFGLVGVYNGIVCVIDYFAEYEQHDNVMYLWNPATKQSKLIPPYTIRNNIESVRAAFGFDLVSHDFKVVRAVHSRDSLWLAEVYSSNMNVWRKVDAVDLSCMNNFYVCVNGFLCYMSLRSMTVFDLNKEVFVSGIKVPALMSHGARIFEVKGSMAVVGFSNDYNLKRSRISLWSLDDDACLHGGRVEASWTLMRSVDLHMLVKDIHCYLNNGDLLLNLEDNGYNFLYDSNMKEFKCFPGEVYGIFKYTQSLVSVT